MYKEKRKIFFKKINDINKINDVEKCVIFEFFEKSALEFCAAAAAATFINIDKISKK
jgi:hypothetical protein